MDTLPAVLRGTLLVLSHTMSLYVMADASERVKHSGLYWTVVSLIIEAVVASLFYVKNFTFYSGGMAFVILGVSYFAAFIYWADGAVVRNIFLYILYITFFMLAASISNLIGKMFFNEDGLAIAYIRSLFSIALIIIYPWKIKKPFQKATDDIGKGWSVLIVFEIVAFLTISVLAFIGAFYLEDNSVYLLLLLMVSFLLLSSFIVVLRMLILLKERNEIRLVKAQQNLLENELESEKEFVENARRYRHDMKQHDRVLFSYLEEERYDEALSYLREYDSNLDRTALNEWCENRVVNALLRITARRFASIDGEFSFRVVLPEDIGLSRPDTTVIFGNILDNAYEACCKAKNPFIEVKASIRNGMLYGEIRNRVDGTISWDNNFPKTTKPNGGTGLKSVKSILLKYNGMLDLSQDKDVFISRIIIPIKTN